MSRLLLAAALLLWAAAAGAQATATNTPLPTATPTPTNTPVPTFGRYMNAVDADTAVLVELAGNGMGRKTVQVQNTAGTVTFNVNCAIVPGGPWTQIYTVNLTTGAAAGGEVWVFEHHCEWLQLQAASCSSCSVSAWADVDLR